MPGGDNQEDASTLAGDRGDRTVETHHTLRTSSGDVSYVARAGLIRVDGPIVEDGRLRGRRPEADVFVVSYTVEPEDTDRPVIFCFNGGPGSSSVWLHLGLFGPRRVEIGDVDNVRPPPGRLVDNDESLLPHADLVFIDPVSTGYSTVSVGLPPGEFHGFSRDIDSLSEVIRLWITRNKRWGSPKYIAGESYGTLRACAIAHHLQRRHDIVANGLVLISTVIDEGAVQFTQGNDLPYGLFLPSLVAIAHHHGFHGQRTASEMRREAEAFVAERYQPALMLGSRLSREERSEVISALAELTGLDRRVVDRIGIRLTQSQFARELLRDQGLIVGAMDGRFTGWATAACDTRPSYDPSDVLIRGQFASAVNDYLRRELQFSTDSPYELFSMERVQPWSYAEFEGQQVTVSDRLAELMCHNPALKIYVALGWLDASTPYHSVEYSFAQLAVPPELRQNVAFHYYDAGHMMYLDTSSRRRQADDIRSFLET
jgi:carboxypeptidase C (cathepsin A)